jgi:hypothetical protein
VRGFWVIPLAVWISVTGALGQDSTQAHLRTAQNRYTAEWQVRPCDPKEATLGSSPEAISSISGEKPVFGWCEALDVPWLSRASILRFHTAIQVDYAQTMTITRATSKSPIWSIWSGEGLSTQPSPSLPNSLGAINDLLRSSQMALRDSHLKSASILYLFLLGSESHNDFFRKPTSKHPLSTADYRATYRKNGVVRVVTLTTRSGEWILTFSSQESRRHLDSVVMNTGH